MLSSSPATTALVLAVLASPILSGEPTLSEQAQSVLRKNCVSCHGSALKMSGLDLRTRESMIAGGTRGAALEPSNVAQSLLYKVVTHELKPSMPPGKKLADTDIDILRRWIEAGAMLESTGEQRAAGDDKAAALAKLEERSVTAEERSFWSFRRPVRHQPPAGTAHPLDAFLSKAWKAKGLKPAPRADARTLIRRAYLDLTGLPPTPAEVDAFAKDSSPQQWKAVVETLLASPHYGERWGRHWLDLVRYADSGGFERDYDWKNAWRYRDYVVSAFNSDKPYNRFIREQIAGDEFEPLSNEAMVATGYLRLGLDNNIKNERTRLDELDDLVSTTSLTFLGLTVGCARCHNHKFDPIPQKDYYQMQAVFFSTKGQEHPLVPPEEVAAHKARVEEIRSLQRPLKDHKNTIEDPYRKQIFSERISALPEYLQLAWRTPVEKRTSGQRLNAEQIEKTLIVQEKDIIARMSPTDREQSSKLAEQIASLEKQLPPPYPTARAITEKSREPLPSYFLHRGAPDAKGSLMSAGVITAATEGDYTIPPAPENAQSSWRRRGFADWAASDDNPLTARVMVNRIWQHHFGEGIVRTPSNFGKTGQAPSHPELLDWLATEFVRTGWSIKAMHRLMMTSDAYQMASDDDPKNVAIDPENRYFWRMARQRLQAEILRDNMLAAAGTLDRTVGGPAVFPFIDPALFQSSTQRNWPGKPDDDPSTWRRSIYVFLKRSIRYPMFEAFDQPDATNSCDRRNRSTVAPQALLLMNNALVVLQASKFAERLTKEAGPAPSAQVDAAYRIALSRPPTEFELSRGVQFLQEKAGSLADFCQLVFNLNEFAYRQ